MWKEEEKEKGGKGLRVESAQSTQESNVWRAVLRPAASQY